MHFQLTSASDAVNQKNSTDLSARNEGVIASESTAPGNRVEADWSELGWSARKL
jgi:hypothetical protein